MRTLVRPSKAPHEQQQAPGAGADDGDDDAHVLYSTELLRDLEEEEARLRGLAPASAPAGAFDGWCLAFRVLSQGQQGAHQMPLLRDVQLREWYYLLPASYLHVLEALATPNA